VTGKQAETLAAAVVRYRATRARYRGALRRGEAPRDRLPLLHAKNRAESALRGIVRSYRIAGHVVAYVYGTELIEALQAEGDRMVWGLAIPPERMLTFRPHAVQRLDHRTHARVRELLSLTLRALGEEENAA